MKKTKLSNAAFSEADIEARVLCVFKKVLPWLSPNGFRFQTTFTFQLGHSMFKVDGTEVSRAQGRADIIVWHDDVALAIFELKRPGWALSADDFKQGQSYARFITPSPPLIIVSNGADTRIYTTHNGEVWPVSDASEHRLAQTIKAAMQVTADQQRDAISLLMGPSSALWVQAVRKSSIVALEELTGEWADEMQPIVREFLIRRDATTEILRALKGGKRTILISGAPLSGKTNVLRQLVTETATSADFVVLYIDLHANTTSVFRAVAYLLEAALSWPATEDETRQWILKLSHRTEGPTLVLAIDGLSSGRQSYANEVGELASAAFGTKLRIVATVDDADVRQLIHDADGRTMTRLGRTAAIVTLEQLNDKEFGEMVSQLAQNRMIVIHGAEKSAEWRQPWIIRALVSAYVDFSVLKNMRLAVKLPPLLGIELLRQAINRFADAPDIRAAYGHLAKVVIATVDHASSSVMSRLEFMSNFTLNYMDVLRVLTDSQISKMQGKGYWRREYKGAGISIVVPRLPELLAAEVAQQLADELVSRSKEKPHAAAKWLVNVVSNLPFGPLIAAKALLDAGSRDEALSFDVVQELVATPPRREKVKVGTKFVTMMPHGLLNVTVLQDGKLEISTKGLAPKIIEAEEDDDSPELIADIFPWLILSYLASTHMVITSNVSGASTRVDYQLLLQLGSCPMILRGAEGIWEENGHFSHWIEGHGEIACHKNGIIEPITESMRMAILRDGKESDIWISAVLASGSIPLMLRTLIALGTVEGITDPDFGLWVKTRIKELRTQINQVHSLDH